MASIATGALPEVGTVVEQGVPELGDMIEGALPPPPRKVVLVTRSYGQVTVDHRAHLARRSPCKSCHGPGPVSKLQPLPPRVAHERCIGCHKAQERGPTQCKQCHQPIPPPPPPAPVVQAQAPSAPPPPPMPDWVASVAASPVETARLSPSLDLGYAAVATSGRGVASGISARVTFDLRDVLLAESFEYVGGGGSSRLIGLAGAGVGTRTHRRVRAFALAVGGFDAWTSNPVALAPAVGARVGVEWDGNLLFRNALSLSVTGLTALGARSDPSGGQIGSTTVGVNASIGIPMTRPR